MVEKKIIKTTCKSCHGGCGVLVEVTDGVITHIEGNPDSTTRGTMCSKGLSSIQHIDNPYRIIYPHKRVGEKGEGKWERISWDEALDTIATKTKEAIEKYGPWTVATSQGTGRGYNRYTHRFSRAMGSANIITPGYVCHSPRLGLYGLVTGYGRLYCDYHGWGGEFPKTQISWAKQLEISSADSEMAYWYTKSLDYCKNLIIIDPRATAYTSRATLWLQIRPGTDAALALGMTNIIIQEELYDKEFVANWTYGFEELKKRAAEYPVEKVSEITWIPKEKIIQVARLYAQDTPGTIQIGGSRISGLLHKTVLHLEDSVVEPRDIFFLAIPHNERFPIGPCTGIVSPHPVVDEVDGMCWFRVVGKEGWKHSAGITTNLDQTLCPLGNDWRVVLILVVDVVNHHCF